MKMTEDHSGYAILSGLYGITNEQLLPQYKLLSAIDSALDGGMKILQYRNKTASAKVQLEQAMALKQLCDDYAATFIINDDIALAQQVDAHGVHLGKKDATLRDARKSLGHDFIIGISCYNQLENALQAQDSGASYVAFGRFFPSQTKPEAAQASPALIAQAKSRLEIPVCSIGGITLENASMLIEQGADMLAVIHDLFSADDIKNRAQQFSQCFL